MTEREVIRRRARATGTHVILVFAPDADPAQPWETICEEHGGVCSHETRKLAEAWLSHPDEWCEDCMYGPGALDGTRSLDGERGRPEARRKMSRSAHAFSTGVADDLFCPTTTTRDTEAIMSKQNESTKGQTKDTTEQVDLVAAIMAALTSEGVDGAELRWAPSGSYASILVDKKNIGYVFKQTRGGVRVEPAATMADLPKSVKLFKPGTRSERFALVGFVKSEKDALQAAQALAVAHAKLTAVVETPAAERVVETPAAEVVVPAKRTRTRKPKAAATEQPAAEGEVTA